MTTRRSFLFATAGLLPTVAKAAHLSSKERVGRAVNGNRAPDRAPFSFWHHFGLEKKGRRATRAPPSRFTASSIPISSR